MARTDVLDLLKQDVFVSGEEMSRALGVSRAAVCKAIGALRAEGFEIDAVPNRGYCLRKSVLSAARVRRLLGSDRIGTVMALTDSTNDELKRLCGAPDGVYCIAAQQTGGRGRRGRQFASPAGGIYLSVLLRPAAEAAELLHLTPMAAVAVRRAIADCCDVEVGIKWINDLVVKGKKLCGILTELCCEADTGHVQSVIVGVGINCNTDPLPEPLRDTATSLRLETGHPIDPNALAAAMVRRLWEMERALQTEKEAYLAEYAACCVTLGKQVQVIREDTRRSAFAEGIDDSGGLIVRYEDGTRAVVSAGEVSVRGMYGYV